MFATRRERILIAVAALLLGIALFFPLWTVSLTAPQYPEGLGMQIWANTITGVKPNDLENINGLNHYIGMKRIEPDSIPELRVMPPGIAAMAVLGAVLALVGRRRLLQVWTVTLLVAGVVGMADFYRWNYDYGHNLDLENAPIKIPGMSYQPPLIGTKQLLNFTATSLPAAGGWLAIGAVGIAVFAAFGSSFRRRTPKTTTDEMRALVVRTATLALVTFTLVACAERPRALVQGMDSCNYCRMTIDDVRYGAQVVTNTGKIETFDSIECLANYLSSLPPSATPRQVLVTDHANPGVWLEAERARFVRSESLRSPMGQAVAAFSSDASTQQLAAQYGGTVLSWTEVRDVMAEHAKTHAIAGAESRELSTPGNVTGNNAAETTAGANHAHHHGVHAGNAPEAVTTRGDTVFVGGGSRVTTLAEAIELVPSHGVVVVSAGVYREPTVIVRKPLTVVGRAGAILDGEEERELFIIGADSVTVRGMTFRNTGTSQASDRAALRVVESAACLIEGNRFERTLFGIYLQRAEACLIRNNTLVGREGSQSITGNGIHLWSSRDVVIERNMVDGHRDGIYFEFVTNGVVRNNTSTNSRRYGLHFMFSDSCRYLDNRFIENESGIAVMYAKRVEVTGNLFQRNRGSAAYGLLLKEITDSEVRGNRFIDNSVGLHLEGASRNRITDNDFVRNGWAVRVLADAQENVLTGNVFTGNLFDVATNSRHNYSTFTGNWWDRYRGYDLDRDGRGDVAHAPVRLFALLLEQSPAALVLVRSVVVDLLDVAERVVPVLTPATLRDEAPLMRAPRRIPS